MDFCLIAASTDVLYIIYEHEIEVRFHSGFTTVAPETCTE